MITEGINKIGDEVFFGGAGFNDFFFVFYDNFSISNLDDFAAVNGEFGVNKAFD